MEADEYNNEIDEIVLSALLILREGPKYLGELTAELRLVGALDTFGDLDLETLMLEIDEMLLDSDDIWMSEDRMVGLASTMLDGVVFTHRLSQSEIDRDVIDATPDIGAIDFNSVDGLEMTTGGMLECHFPFEGEPELSESGSFTGPPGMLAPFSVGDLVCLKRTGSSVSVEKMGEPGPGEAEAAALLAVFENQHVVGLGVEPESLVMDALCHDLSLFRSPVLPVGELLEHIGLEESGGWFGLKGEDWEPPSVRYAEREIDALRGTWDFDECCDDAFGTVFAAFTDHDSNTPLERDELRTVAKALGHESVAPALAEFVLKHAGPDSDELASFAAQMAQVTGKLAAPALYLQGIDAEHGGDALTAEAHLRSAVLSDPDYGPALLELAWYEADHGEANRAISFLTRAGIEDDDLELDYLSSQVPKSSVQAGRNDPCPCGSGRKFKACCINGATRTIEQRAGWLYHKAAIFFLRPKHRDQIEQLVELANYGLDTSALHRLLPFLVDVALFEGGNLGEFLLERGSLLPTDELILAQTWVGTPLVLWEVDQVVPGATVVLRNTRSGEKTLVTEHTASEILDPGDYVLARVVAIGSEHQIVGNPLPATLQQRESLIELLDSEPDVIDYAMWLAIAFSPPRLTNHEGEDLMLCRAVLRPRSGDWDQLARELSDRYGPAEDGLWTETIQVEGDNLVRCFLRRLGDDLFVEANSAERYERMLLVLLVEFNSDLEVIEAVRLSPDEAPTQWAGSSELSWPAESGKVPDQVRVAMTELMRQKELAWLDESVPALSGLTPRQAADDPTRREDLVALLKEFERKGDPPPEAMSFDVALLRRELGL